MLSILSTVFDICLLRRGPQDMPPGWTMAGAALMAYLLVYVLVLTKTNSADVDVAPALLSAALLIAVSVVTLKFRRLEARLPQTISALASAGAMLSLVMLPVLIIVTNDIDADRPTNVGFALLILVAFAWSWVIDAHVFRRALSTTFTVGVLISAIWFSFDFYIRQLLIGPSS